MQKMQALAFPMFYRVLGNISPEKLPKNSNLVSRLTILDSRLTSHASR